MDSQGMIPKPNILDVSDRYKVRGQPVHHTGLPVEVEARGVCVCEGCGGDGLVSRRKGMKGRMIGGDKKGGIMEVWRGEGEE